MASTTIAIDSKTREALKKFGYKDETYDQIIHRLMETARRETLYQRQKHILETEEFVSIDDL